MLSSSEFGAPRSDLLSGVAYWPLQFCTEVRFRFRFCTDLKGSDPIASRSGGWAGRVRDPETRGYHVVRLPCWSFVQGCHAVAGLLVFGIVWRCHVVAAIHVPSGDDRRVHEGLRECYDEVSRSPQPHIPHGEKIPMLLPVFCTKNRSAEALCRGGPDASPCILGLRFCRVSCERLRALTLKGPRPSLLPTMCSSSSCEAHGHVGEGRGGR